MDDWLTQWIDIIPLKWRATASIVILASMLIGRAYKAIRNGGGLKSVLSSIWLGTNTPKPPAPPEP